MWKGKRIIGNPSAIKALRKALSPKVPSPTPKVPSPKAKVPILKAKVPTPIVPTGEKNCYKGYTLTQLELMKNSELTKLFGKEGGLNLRGAPKRRDEMIGYLCSVEQNRRCTSPDWECDGDLVCDASNQPGEGVCIPSDLADKRNFETIMWKGKRIIGNPSAMKALKKALSPKVPSPTPKVPSPTPKVPSPTPKVPILKAKVPTPTVPTGEKNCYGGYTLTQLELMGRPALNQLFVKEGGLKLRGRPNNRDEMIGYLCSVEQNRRCKSPEWECEGDLVCDASNQPDEGVCIPIDLANDRLSTKGIHKMIFNGKTIIGNITAIKSLRKALSPKVPDFIPQTPDDDVPYNDDDTTPVPQFCIDPEWNCDDNLVCDTTDYISNGKGVCVKDGIDNHIKLKINGKIISGKKEVLENLMNTLGYNLPDTFVKDLNKYLTFSYLTISLEDLVFTLRPLAKEIEKGTLTKDYINNNIYFTKDFSRTDIFENVYKPWLTRTPTPVSSQKKHPPAQSPYKPPAQSPYKPPAQSPYKPPAQSPYKPPAQSPYKPPPSSYKPPVPPTETPPPPSVNDSTPIRTPPITPPIDSVFGATPVPPKSIPKVVPAPPKSSPKVVPAPPKSSPKVVPAPPKSSPKVVPPPIITLTPDRTPPNTPPITIPTPDPVKVGSPVKGSPVKVGSPVITIPLPLQEDPGTPLVDLPNTPPAKSPAPKPPKSPAKSPAKSPVKSPAKSPVKPFPEDGTPVPVEDTEDVEDLLSKIQEIPDVNISDLTEVQKSVLKCLKLI
jgi:hypothetical protein